MSAQTPTFKSADGSVRCVFCHLHRDECTCNNHPLWEIVQRPTKSTKSGQEEDKMEYYYEASVVSLGTATGYCGRVYHFDAAGSKEVTDFKGPVRRQEPEALDDAADYLDENNLSAQLL